jgi:hypothetical protein
VADLSKIKIYWDGNNSQWMNRLLDWLEGNPMDQIKLFSHSLQEAKVGNQKKLQGRNQNCTSTTKLHMLSFLLMKTRSSGKTMPLTWISSHEWWRTVCRCIYPIDLIIFLLTIILCQTQGKILWDPPDSEHDHCVVVMSPGWVPQKYEWYVNTLYTTQTPEYTKHNEQCKEWKCARSLSEGPTDNPQNTIKALFVWDYKLDCCEI